MEDFTPEQNGVIANAYCSMARALNQFQVMRWTEFLYEQQLDLNAYQTSLLNRAHDLQTMAARPAFQNPAAMTSAVQQAMSNAESSLTHIRNLSVALNIGAVMVALAAYVARANLRGIETALRELSELVKVEDQEP
jgi:hypothetical protein